MGRQCSVCLHDKRDAIDQALIRGTSYRNIMEQYNLSLGAVSRHYHNHLPETLRKAHAIKEVASADKLLARIEDLITEAEGLLEYGKSKKEGRDWKSGLQELRKCFELLARVSGVLDEQPQVNIVTNPQWIQLRTQLIQILSDFPEAKKKVLEAFNANSNPGN